MPGGKDLTGKNFGRLTVLSLQGLNKYRCRVWLCQCTCGVRKIIDSRSLLRKVRPVKSCGCLKTDTHTKHGYRGKYKTHKLYYLLKGMKDRCHKTNNSSYKDYGGRGIIVYRKWREDVESFIDYCYTIQPDLDNLLKNKYQIDRIDNNGNYEPGNIRFVTAKVNSGNRRNTVKIVYNNQEYLFSELTELTGISYSTLKFRIFYKRLPIEKALTDPVKRKGYPIFYPKPIIKEIK